jgi:hypothetical protein
MRERWRECVAVVLGYTALSLLATWPLALHFSSHAVGSPWWGPRRISFDTPLSLWNLWWFRHALVDLHQSPFQCQYIFYPYGANLWFHTLAPLHGLLGLVLQSVFSLAATRNLLLLLDLVASGGSAYLLARHLGAGGSGAFIAGTIYAFSPGIFAHLYVGHFELISTFWMPAALLLFLRLLASPRPRWLDGLLLGTVFIGAAYTSQYYVVYGVELLGLAAILHWRRVGRAAVLKSLGVTVVVALLGISPILWAFLGPDAPEPIRPTAEDFDEFSGDLAGFLVPSFTHSFLSKPLENLHARIYITAITPDKHVLHLKPPQETTVFVGFSVLGLALSALARRRRAGGPITLPFVIVVVFGMLSLGAHLKVYGFNTGVPLPAGLLAHLPVLQFARAPGRHIVLVMLGMGILAGMGWQGIRRGAVRWGVLGLLALEYTAVPLPLFSTKVPVVYHRLAQEPGSFAILEIPLGVGDGLRTLGPVDITQLLGQTVHGHPIVSGAVSRLAMERWMAIVGSPVIGTLLDPGGVSPDRLEQDRTTGPAYFARWRIQAVLIHPQARNGKEQRYLEEVLRIRGREDFADGSQILWVEDQS